MPKKSRAIDTAGDSAPLSSAIGEFWSTRQLLDHTGAPRERIEELINANQLLHCTTADDQRLFPAFQFAGTRVRPALVPVLQQLLPANDGWSVTLQLMTPLDDFDGRTALDVIERGTDDERAQLLQRLGRSL